MDEHALSDLIDQTKEYLKETYYGKSKIFIEGHKPEKKVTESAPQVSLSDFYKEPLDKIKVALLVRSEDPQEKILIEKMGAAIDSKIAKARVFKTQFLEEHNLWGEWRAQMKSLEHILVSELEFYQMPKLLTKYQTQPKRQVFDVPLFFLADLKTYNQDLELKKSLWATLLKEL